MKVNSVFKGTIGKLVVRNKITISDTNSLIVRCIGIGLLLGLLIGTVLYIIGGYFLPFLVYSAVMLLVVPLSATLVPSKPLEEAPKGYTDKNSDEDLEIGGDNSNYISNNEMTKLEKTDSKDTKPVSKVKDAPLNKIQVMCNLLTNKVC